MKNQVGTFVLAALLSTSVARADDDGPRTLGRLQFVPSALVAWGFVDNTFAVTTSAGYVRYGVGPSDTIAARVAIADRNVTLIGLAHTISGAVKLAPWLGFAGRVTGAVTIPRGTTALALAATHASAGVEGDVFVRVIRTGSLQVTARGDFARNQNRDILASRIDVGHVTMIRPVVTAAVAVMPELGLEASASYAFQWFDAITTGRMDTLHLGTAAIFSLHPIPVSLLFGAGFEHTHGDTPDVFAAQALYGSGGYIGILEGGVFYTGRRDLDLGLATTYSFSDTDGDRRWYGSFRLGYYF